MVDTRVRLSMVYTVCGKGWLCGVWGEGIDGLYEG